MNGILLIDKPTGMTSRDVVNKISHILKIKRVGHTGTLDPMATGVLVLCVGKATKISELITAYDKEYIAEVKLGVSTDTLDTEGEIIDEITNVNVTKEQVENTLKHFVGKIEQEVPIYSAIRVEGRRLYRYARSHTDVELPKREIEIYDLSLISDLKKIDGKITFQIKAHVSKGTYIRSLVRDIGLKLDYPACMSSLRRVKQGDFKIEECYTLDDVVSGNYKLLETNDVLSYLQSITVDGELERKIRNGAIVDKIFTGDIAKIVSSGGELIAIYRECDENQTKMRPFKMF